MYWRNTPLSLRNKRPWSGWIIRADQQGNTRWINLCSLNEIEIALFARWQHTIDEWPAILLSQPSVIALFARWQHTINEWPAILLLQSSEIAIFARWQHTINEWPAFLLLQPPSDPEQSIGFVEVLESVHRLYGSLDISSGSLSMCLSRRWRCEGAWSVCASRWTGSWSPSPYTSFRSGTFFSASCCSWGSFSNFHFRTVRCCISFDLLLNYAASGIWNIKKRETRVEIRLERTDIAHYALVLNMYVIVNSPGENARIR